MRHPNDGTLRRLLDEPAGVAGADRAHVARCPVCLAGLTAAREDAAVASAALTIDPGTGMEAAGVDAAGIDAAWHRLNRAMPSRRPVASPAPTHRWRAALRSPVVAVAGVIILAAGASAAAAADWLQIFHTEQITPVTAPRAELVSLPDLSGFGELEVTEKIDIREVADPAAAEAAAGLSVPRVSELPRGVTGSPTYSVAGRVSAVFTFSAEKTAQTAAAAGKTLPAPPPGLDGSKFRFVAGPGLAAVWSQGRPVPALIVARAVAPTVYSSGTPFETVRDYLLPVLPENIAAQLRGFSGDRTTLPLIMSAERLTSSSADVGGAPATVLTSRDGVLAAVVWVDDTSIVAVAGSLTPDEVLSVARGLRWGR
jgi:hypothetical protein